MLKPIALWLQQRVHCFVGKLINDKNNSADEEENGSWNGNGENDDLNIPDWSMENF